MMNEQWAIEEIKMESKKFLQPNGNHRATSQNLGDTVKAVLGGKFIQLVFMLLNHKTIK